MHVAHSKQGYPAATGFRVIAEATSLVVRAEWPVWTPPPWVDCGRDRGQGRISACTRVPATNHEIHERYRLP